MNWKLLTVIGAIVIVLVVVALYLTLKPHAPASQTNQNPFASTTGTTIPAGTKVVTIQGTDGSTYSVPDFTQGKKADVLPAGTYYHLTDNQDTQGPQAQFEIQYGTDSSITIVLLKEPLGAARLAAEASLRTFFPLPNASLCKLDVFLDTPVSVNEAYADQNLGLSFCPGSVPLP